jgi:hypothetical protein
MCFCLLTLCMIRTAMHPLVGQQLANANSSIETSSMFASEFTLTLLEDSVVQETTSSFIEAIRPDSLSLEIVHLTRSRANMPVWNTLPTTSSLLLSLGNDAMIDGEFLGLSEVLRAMDPETPLAVDDLVVTTTQDVDMCAAESMHPELTHRHLDLLEICWKSSSPSMFHPLRPVLLSDANLWIPDLRL